MPTKSIVAMTSQPTRRHRTKPPLNLPVVPLNKIGKAKRRRRWKCSCGYENTARARACANCRILKPKLK